MKIAIVGAGWYGCHLGISLKNLGFDVIIYEKNDAIFEEASSKNQNRLHLGFHYARDAATRIQTKNGFEAFENLYNFTIEEINDNIYAIPDLESQICPETYRLTMVSAGLQFEQVDPKKFGIKNCTFGFKTKEKVINWQIAKDYFNQRLNNQLKLSTKIENFEEREDSIILDNDRFDFLIDCSWGQLNSLKKDVYFEPCILLRYKAKKQVQNFSVTLVDGRLPSIYPEAGLKTVTLSSVTNTPLGMFANWDEASDCIELFSHINLEKKIEKMESELKYYLPEAFEYLDFIEPQFSIKTKKLQKSANRECSVKRTGRVIEVMSGKIDTIFTAQKEVLTLMSQHCQPIPQNHQISNL